MGKITLGHIPKLTIQEIAILPIETLLEFEAAADDHLVAAKRLCSCINGAIAIRHIRNEKAINGGCYE